VISLDTTFHFSGNITLMQQFVHYIQSAVLGTSRVTNPLSRFLVITLVWIGTLFVRKIHNHSSADGVDHKTWFLAFIYILFWHLWHIYKIYDISTKSARLKDIKIFSGGKGRKKKNIQRGLRLWM